jgi:hypothetical protein
MTGGTLHAGADFDLAGDWLNRTATGDEYGGAFVAARVHLASLLGAIVLDPDYVLISPVPMSGEASENTLQSRAAALARSVPAVQTARPVVPELTGELLEDVRIVTGLTLDQIGRAIGVSGRAVAGWRAGTVPHHREPFLQALRSIGLSLVGGLGSSGVQRWFLAGTPPRLDRLAAGDVDSVAAEARAYETSPAT